MAASRLDGIHRLLLFTVLILFFVASSPVLCKQLKCSSEHSKQPKQSSSLRGKSSTSLVSVCRTSACTEVGKSLYQAIDFCADPCEDFYAFSCGNWATLHPVSSSEEEENASSGSSTFSLMVSEVDALLKKLLLSTSTKSSKSKAVALAKDLYRECLDVEARKKIHFSPLQKEFADITGYEWPISQEQAKLVDEASAAATDYKEALMKALIRFIQIEKSPVVDLFIDQDINDTTTSIFYFSVPEGFDKDKIIYLNEERYQTQISYYVREILALTKEVHGLKAEETDTAELEITSRIWEFELALVNASTPIEQVMEDPKEGYNRMSLKEFEDATGNEFSWSALVKLFVQQFNLQAEKITADTQVIVGDVEYFRRLPKILAETPLHVVYNYLGMRLFYTFRNQSDTPIEEQCLAVVTAKFDQAVSRLYVDEHVTPGVTKQQAAKLIADIRASFRRVIQKGAKWLDEKTKAKVLEKESATKFESVFPDWLLDDNLLDAHYGLEENKNLSVKTGHFLETMLDIRRHRMVTFSRKMGYTIKENKLGAANVNAHANKFANEVYLPAAIFQRPLFDADLPPSAAYLNYASIGFFIGHEIIHNFDSEGRYFNADGHLMLPETSGKNDGNWWPEAVIKSFEEGGQCFSRQYGSMREVQSGLHLKGNFTLAENLSDNGGLSIAYEAAFGASGTAFSQRKKRFKHQLVPKMEAFTAEQLFFVRFARSWCANYDNVSMALTVDTDDHSPERFRVNVPLANFAPFSAAFGCPRGTRMNPVEKCVIW